MGRAVRRQGGEEPRSLSGVRLENLLRGRSYITNVVKFPPDQDGRDRTAGANRPPTRGGNPPLFRPWLMAEIAR